MKKTPLTKAEHYATGARLHAIDQQLGAVVMFTQRYGVAKRHIRALLTAIKNINIARSALDDLYFDENPEGDTRTYYPGNAYRVRMPDGSFQEPDCGWSNCAIEGPHKVSAHAHGHGLKK